MTPTPAPPVTAEQSLVRAPLWPLAVAGVLVAAAALLLAVAYGTDRTEDMRITAAGYVLGAVLASGFVTLHRQRTLAARRSVWFSPRVADRHLAPLFLVLGIGVALVHAFHLATELAK